VTAPKVALLTSQEYFAKAPRRAYGFGAFQDARRRFNSAATIRKDCDHWTNPSGANYWNSVISRT